MSWSIRVVPCTCVQSLGDTAHRYSNLEPRILVTMSGTECLIFNILEVKQLKIGHNMISCHCRQTLTQGIREAIPSQESGCKQMFNCLERWGFWLYWSCELWQRGILQLSGVEGRDCASQLPRPNWQPVARAGSGCPPPLPPTHPPCVPHGPPTYLWIPHPPSSPLMFCSILIKMRHLIECPGLIPCWWSPPADHPDQHPPCRAVEANADRRLISPRPHYKIPTMTTAVLKIMMIMMMLWWWWWCWW